MAGLRERFGRPLRLGIIGGGPDSWIGRTHRGAAEYDGWWHAVAGVFSSDPARSRAAGTAMGFDPARSYGTVADLIAQCLIAAPDADTAKLARAVGDLAERYPLYPQL